MVNAFKMILILRFQIKENVREWTFYTYIQTNRHNWFDPIKENKPNTNDKNINKTKSGQNGKIPFSHFLAKCLIFEII